MSAQRSSTITMHAEPPSDQRLSMKLECRSFSLASSRSYSSIATPSPGPNGKSSRSSNGDMKNTLTMSFPLDPLPFVDNRQHQNQHQHHGQEP
ncbi:hypothetical protein GGF37_007562, partial [Kickxella alabastrina]